MRYVVALLACICLWPGGRAHAATEQLEPAQTYAVIAGVLAWPDQGFGSFPAADRKDRELYETLGRRGVPAAQRVLLLDAQATTANITAAVRQLAAVAPAGSTFVFYYAGHGVKVDGDVVFASVDIDSRDLAHTGLHLSALAPLFAGFKGRNVVLLGDCCHSGGLAQVARALHEQGLRAVALTSADAANTSTANWTFTQTLIDALNGRDLLDLDDGGTISLGELAQDVKDAMMHREYQYYGYADFGVPEALVLATTRPARARLDAGLGPYQRRGWVLADKDGEREPARVLGADAARHRLLVAFYDYATESTRWVAPADVAPMRFATFPIGARVDVSYEGKSYEARILAVKEGFHLVTYPGWDASWDEWVMANRIDGVHEERHSDPAALQRFYSVAGWNP